LILKDALFSASTMMLKFRQFEECAADVVINDGGDAGFYP